MKHNGFTLIELMVVLAVVAVLSALAVPSYQQFVVRNAQADVKSELLDIYRQTEKWKSTRLTYKGFKPLNGDDSGTKKTPGFDTINNEIYFPHGTKSTNYSYIVKLVDGAGKTELGNNWTAVAKPRSTGIVSKARAYMIDNVGNRCYIEHTNDEKFDETTGCIASSKTW